MLLLHALGVLAFQLLDHLRVCLLGIGLIVEVHLLLQLERLLELLLELLQVGLRLVTLRLQELEATLPKSSLLVEDVTLLLELRSRVVKLAPELLIAVGSAHLVILNLLAHRLVRLTQVADLGLVVLDEFLPLLLEVGEFLLKNGLLSLPSRRHTNQALLNLLELFTLGLVLGLSSLFLLQ